MAASGPCLTSKTAAPPARPRPARASPSRSPTRRCPQKARYPVRHGAAVAKLPADTAWLDGEACHVEDDGRTSFSGLQDELSAGRTVRVAYFVFDLLYLDGYDLSGVALEARKAELAALLARGTAPLAFSDHVVSDGPTFHAHACGLRLEGIVSKRRDSPYRADRSALWLKTKCLNREKFVIVGWTDPEGSRVGFSSL